MARRHLIVTLHGIRTYGRWQTRLEKIAGDAALQSTASKPEFEHYTYGYFDLLKFLIPFARNSAVANFRQWLQDTLEGEHYASIDLVAHSFGTYIAISALESDKLPDTIQIRRAVLCGSVLTPDYNLSGLLGPKRRIHQLINDCGTKDGVLLLTLFVWGVGMAGRLGLHGFQGRILKSRFFHLGHSGYFLDEHGVPSDEFMKRWWLPILLTQKPIASHDDRPESPPIMERIWRTLGENHAATTLSIYAIVATLSFSYVYSLYAKAEAALARTFTERAWTALDKIDPNPILAAKYALAGWQLSPNNEPVYEAPLSYVLSAPSPSAVKCALHEGAVLSLAVSPDRTHAISTGEDGKAILWSTRSLKCIPPFDHKGSAVTAATFDATSSKVATFTSDGKIYIWDIATGTPDKELPGTDHGPITGGSFTPKGTRLLVYSEVADIWDLQKSEPISSVQEPISSVQMSDPRDPMAFSDNGELIASGSDQFVYVMDAVSGTLFPPLKSDADEVTAVGFSADSKFLFAGLSDKRVLVWDISNKFKLVSQLTGHEAPIKAISLLPHKKRAHVIDTRGNAYVWDLESVDMLVARLNSPIDAEKVNFSPDGGFAVIQSENREGSLWDADVVRTIGGLFSRGVTAVSWISDNELILGYGSGKVRIFTLEHPKQSATGLAHNACSDQSFKNATFSQREVAADPLIKDVWDPKQKVCSCIGAVGCARVWIGKCLRLVQNLF